MIDLILGAALSLAPPPPAGSVMPPRLRSGAITNADYPSAAIQAGDQGSVRIALDVTPHGSVSACRIDRSSGSAVLDATTCSIATQRFKFSPGRDARGARVASTYRQTVRWVLPEDGPSGSDFADLLPVFGNGELRLAMAQDSMGVRCALETSGEAFSMGAELLCPTQSRVELSELMGDRAAMLTVTTLTPEGSPAAERRPVRGILVARIGSDIEVAPDGNLASCRDVDLPSPRGGMSAPSLCQATNSPFPAFRRDASGQTRRGRVQIEIYRLGAPET